MNKSAISKLIGLTLAFSALACGPEKNEKAPDVRSGELRKPFRIDAKTGQIMGITPRFKSVPRNTSSAADLMKDASALDAQLERLLHFATTCVDSADRDRAGYGLKNAPTLFRNLAWTSILRSKANEGSTKYSAAEDFGVSFGERGRTDVDQWEVWKFGANESTYYALYASSQTDGKLSFLSTLELDRSSRLLTVHFEAVADGVNLGHDDSVQTATLDLSSLTMSYDDEFFVVSKHLSFRQSYTSTYDISGNDISGQSRFQRVGFDDVDVEDSNEWTPTGSNLKCLAIK